MFKVLNQSSFILSKIGHDWSKITRQNHFSVNSEDKSFSFWVPMTSEFSNAAEISFLDGTDAKEKLSWSHKMINTMLRIRFEDEIVARKLRNAVKKEEKDVAWTYFAAVLTEELGIVINMKQLRSKYAKEKFEHAKWSQDVARTGNQESKGRAPGYMPILCEWFATRKGAGTGIIFDLEQDVASSGENDKEESDEIEQPSKRQRREAGIGRQSGVNLLADRVGSGMAAIANAVKAPDTNKELLEMTKQQLEMTARLIQTQELQTKLLEALVANTQNNRD
ncbi:hypothetical protein AC1031_002143 [Aphanomyces cochlioides]|nr:hypothetical protein AC1031_002143 [Aphanomyces cochlioides]